MVQFTHFVLEETRGDGGDALEFFDAMKVLLGLKLRTLFESTPDTADRIGKPILSEKGADLLRGETFMELMRLSSMIRDCEQRWLVSFREAEHEREGAANA